MDEELGELNAFRIRSRQRVLDLAASSKEEKEEWMNNICNIIKDYEAKRGSVLKQHLEQEAQKESDEVDRSRVGESAPVWVKDEDVTMCMLCAVRFSLLSRRHHCRACGRVCILSFSLCFLLCVFIFFTSANLFSGTFHRLMRHCTESICGNV